MRVSITTLSFLSLFLFTCSSCNKIGSYAEAPKFIPETIVDANDTTLTFISKNDVKWDLIDITIDKTQVISHERWLNFPNLSFSYDKENPAIKGADYPYLIGIYQVNYEWFEWEKINDRKFILKLTKNNSNNKRYVSFHLFAGNASQTVEITQE